MTGPRHLPVRRKAKLRWPCLPWLESPIPGFAVADRDQGQMIRRDDVLDPWSLDFITPEAALREIAEAVP
jgi:hypothetical protein